MTGGSPMLPQKKRAQPADPTFHLPKLLEHEQKLYVLIERTKNTGMVKTDLKKESPDLQKYMFDRALKALQSKNLIKEVPNIKNKRNKIYMAKQFEPSEEVSGGQLYVNGQLDTDFVEALRMLCLGYLNNNVARTLEEMWGYCKNSPVLADGCSMQQVSEIVCSLVELKEVEELKRSGPEGDQVCYRRLQEKGKSTAGALSSIPCLICPRIRECTPDGVISPITCEYFKKWLNF